MPARSLLVLLALSLLPAAPLSAQAQDALPGTGERQAIRQVIESQLAAFRRDDGGAAFGFAAPGIQRKFGTPAVFMDMVRSGYPMVYRPRAVEFRDLRLENGRLIQDVFFVGPDGRAVLAHYIMERQDDGRWRIAGVYLSPAPERIS